VTVGTEHARSWRPGYPVNARLVLSSLQRGPHDPAHRIGGDGTIWRASRMATGPVSYRIAQLEPSAVRVQAWGQGAPELLDGLPRLLGAEDRPETFTPTHPVLVRAARELPGYRVPCTGRVVEALVPAVLEQRVIGLDAFDAWRRLVSWHGEPAPGPAPAGMRVPPDAARWREIPTWDWHRAGVDPGRQRAVRSALTLADGVERAAARGDRAAVYQALLAVPGVGIWTVAEVGSRALGDADALPLGDYHLPALAGIALGEGTKLPEDAVEEFFEPWRPHRFRVVRLIELAPSVRIPRRGPRLTRQDHRRH
jgi:3-methyladenine DNA glycosylase/8-oxoguanine DNA glycosylase